MLFVPAVRTHSEPWSLGAVSSCEQYCSSGFIGFIDLHKSCFEAVRSKKEEKGWRKNLLILSLNRKIHFAASLEQTHASSGEYSEVKLEIPGVRVNNSEVKTFPSKIHQ